MPPTKSNKPTTKQVLFAISIGLALPIVGAAIAAGVKPKEIADAYRDGRRAWGETKSRNKARGKQDAPTAYGLTHAHELNKQDGKATPEFHIDIAEHESSVDCMVVGDCWFETD